MTTSSFDLPVREELTLFERLWYSRAHTVQGVAYEMRVSPAVVRRWARLIGLGSRYRKEPELLASEAERDARAIRRRCIMCARAFSTTLGYHHCPKCKRLIDGLDHEEYSIHRG